MNAQREVINNDKRGTTSVLDFFLCTKVSFRDICIMVFSFPLCSLHGMILFPELEKCFNLCSHTYMCLNDKLFGYIVFKNNVIPFEVRNELLENNDL